MCESTLIGKSGEGILLYSLQKGARPAYTLISPSETCVRLLSYPECMTINLCCIRYSSHRKPIKCIHSHERRRIAAPQATQPASGEPGPEGGRQAPEPLASLTLLYSLVGE